MTVAYISLGRFGDIINALPIAWEESRIRGTVDWIVSEEFASVLEGCSYVRPVIYRGKYWDLLGAVNQFKDKYDELRIVQAWSSNYHCLTLTESFSKSAWAQIGRKDWPGRLVFDRRNPEREERLFATMLMGHEPIKNAPILVALDSTSSPFPHRRELLDSLRSTYGERIWPLDPTVHRIYDLLGLFERAACLVTVDTAHLHLSWAVPHLPAVALIADHPSKWHGTACRPNQVFRCRYREYPKRATELLAAVERSINPRPEPKLWHCYSEYDREGGALDRYEGARASWHREYATCKWVDWGVEEATKSLDQRELPLVRDLLDGAADSEACSPSDLLVITNDDTGFSVGLTETLIDVAHWPLPAAYAHRMDCTDQNALDGDPYCGVDLFAVGVTLWKEWRKEFPDVVIGAEQWDLVMLAFMRRVGAPNLAGAIWHQPHHPSWAGNHAWKSNIWNRQQAGKWFGKYHLSAEEVIENMV